MNYIILLMCLAAASAYPAKRAMEEMAHENHMEMIINAIASGIRGNAYFSAFDSNEDGVVTMEEYMEIVMNKSDTTGDGMVSEKEFAGVMNDAAKLQLMILRIDTDGDGLISKQEMNEFVNKNYMNPNYGNQNVTDDAQPAMSTITRIEHDLNKYGMTEGHLLFIAIDLDHDGYITVDEAKATFQQIDTNGDKSVTRHEFISLFAFANGAVFIFEQMDMNHDGRLDNREILYLTIHKQLEGLDVESDKENDEDGTNNMDNGKKNKGDKKGIKKVKRSLGGLDTELANAYNITAEHILFEVYDINGDGRISKEEYVKIFMSKDFNRDGFLTPDEFHGAFAYVYETMRYFVRFDRNNDGLIDLREYLMGFFDNVREMMAANNEDDDFEIGTWNPETTTEEIMAGMITTEQPAAADEIMETTTTGEMGDIWDFFE